MIDDPERFSGAIQCLALTCKTLGRAVDLSYSAEKARRESVQAFERACWCFERGVPSVGWYKRGREQRALWLEFEDLDRFLRSIDVEEEP